MADRTVRTERTGWRDNALSERHRRWGWDCPMVDVDWLALEYDQGKASILVEYKHESAQPQYRNHPTYQALCDLGNRADLPVFAVRYAADFSWWRVVALNDAAQRWVPERIELSEPEYVALLHRIRGRVMPADLFERMNTEV